MTHFPAIDRRTLLKGLTARALTLPPLSRAHAAPKRGGNLRIGMAGGNTTDTLDPATYIDGGMFLVGNTSKDTLVQMSSKDDVEPGARMGGTPARPFKDWAREVAALKLLGRPRAAGPKKPAGEPGGE